MQIRSGLDHMEVANICSHICLFKSISGKRIGDRWGKKTHRILNVEPEPTTFNFNLSEARDEIYINVDTLDMQTHRNCFWENFVPSHGI